MSELLKGYKFFKFDVCDSTMDTCKDLLSQNQPITDTSLVVVADQQEKGRGRRGRTWKSDIGNLYISIGFNYPESVEIAQLSFVTALAVGQTVLHFGKDCDLAYKWPNDIFIKNKKVGGILIETQNVENEVIIGMGVNILKSPSLVGYDATNLKEYGVHVQSDDFLKVLIKNFDFYKNKWITQGFQFIRDEWLEKAWKLNENISVKNGKGKVVEGIFKGIDPKGGLIIQQAEHEEVLYSAQIIR